MAVPRKSIVSHMGGVAKCGFFVTKNCVLTSARVAVKIPDPLKILSHKSSEVIQFNTVLELKLHLPLQIPNRDLNCNGRAGCERLRAHDPHFHVRARTDAQSGYHGHSRQWTASLSLDDERRRIVAPCRFGQTSFGHRFVKGYRDARLVCVLMCTSYAQSCASCMRTYFVRSVASVLACK